jgi:ribosomal protein S18 acetylase RimI-like enzyme
MGEVELRAATQEDAGFLYNLLKTTMQQYVAQTWGWDERWQQEHFRESFEPSKERVVVLGGQDIGVISVEQKEDEVFLSKIYILPEYQGQGIGTHLIRSILDQAFESGLPVALRVLRVNPAKRLYERLGFVDVGETETHYLMKAIPDHVEAVGVDCLSREKSERQRRTEFAQTGRPANNRCA